MSIIVPVGNLGGLNPSIVSVSPIAGSVIADGDLVMFDIYDTNAITSIASIAQFDDKNCPFNVVVKSPVDTPISGIWGVAMQAANPGQRVKIAVSGLVQAKVYANGALSPGASVGPDTSSGGILSQSSLISPGLGVFLGVVATPFSGGAVSSGQTSVGYVLFDGFAAIASGMTRQSVDPTQEMLLYSDFVADTSPFGFVSGTSGNPSSATVTYDNNIASNVFGYAIVTVNGTAGSRGGIFVAPSSSTDVQRKINTPSGYDFTARVSFTTQGGGNQRVLVGLGLSHGPAGDTMLQYGAAFVAYGNTGNWMAAVASNNVVDQIDTGVPSSGWATLRIKINESANQFKFYANGNLVRTVDGVPWDMESVATAWGVEARDKNVGGTGAPMICLVDYMALRRRTIR